MARILRNWNRLNRQDRVSAARTAHTKLTGNTDVPTPNPTLAAFNTEITAAQALIDEVAALELTLQGKRSARDAKIDSVVRMMGQQASTVEGATGGDPTKLINAGFQIVEQATAPVGELPAPQDLRASAGDNEGELDAVCDAVNGAHSYEWQTSADPNDPATWVTRTTGTRSFVTLTGLPSGGRCWVRVRAIGAAGYGAWSDPAAKMVP